MDEMKKAYDKALVVQYKKQIEYWTECLFELLREDGEVSKMYLLEGRIQWRLTQLQQMGAII